MLLCYAFLLDLLIGDPYYPFHPVRVMGLIAKGFDYIFNHRYFYFKKSIRLFKCYGHVFCMFLVIFYFRKIFK